ncbi:hypothetical protein AMATHDRAFT_1587 [Amanita thiersii Skay4041]|uniref:Uncharacterized protein n=1 Tax=Amanita thiersii Skay4041 TaxID=703135 RepID=A0A2A9NST4_9AGAR|nr:hypothetical protein AMATHDRAFT_1587 [Amanita thiersii Skay4041]
MSGDLATQPVSAKINTAKQKKDTGDQAFKNGDLKAALQSYHEALMYLVGLDKNALESMGASSSAKPGSPESEQKTEIDELISKIYANMSACHIKQGNWKRTIETADKALTKNEKNYKAMFRKAKALGEQGYFEKAEALLKKLKEQNPTDASAADAELSRLRTIDNERDRVNRQRMKGFLKKQDLSSQDKNAEEAV